MSALPPRFDDLVDAELPAEEHARLQAVHALLVAAGPPPELPPGLAEPPVVPAARALPFPRRYRYTAVAAAAAAAAVLLGVGYLFGTAGGSSQPAVRTVEMRGPGGASGSIALFAKDAAGNWPMELTVRGLPPLPEGRTYELWLTRGGELAESCGTFVAAGPETVVQLNAPYRLSQFSGWVVTTGFGPDAPGAFVLRTEQT